MSGSQSSPQSSPLDAAAQAMALNPDAQGARLAFHGALFATELFVWLLEESRDGQLAPRVLELSEGRAVLAFDSEARLAAFAGSAVPYAALPGRVLVAMLAGQGGLMLAVNPDGEAPALVDAQMLAWAAATLAAAPEDARMAAPHAVGALPLAADRADLLVGAVQARLRGAPGLAEAVLAGVTWQPGAPPQPVLALGGVPDAVQPPLARAAAEALALSGAGEVLVDVIFPDENGMKRLRAQGRALDITAPPAPEAPAPQAPGMDPTKPPRLR